jgi:enoyl-CoA hydratase/carnithine racemase
MQELILNNPKGLNCISIEMQMSFVKQFRSWHEDPIMIPRVQLMYGSGDKAFCAGGDIKYAT